LLSCRGLPAGLVSATAATGAGNSYGALVRKTLGPKAEATLQFAVFANCYIMEIVFVVVLGDILVGTSPEFGGLLPEWTGRSPTDCIWLRRDVVLGAMSLLVLLPLAAMRSMEKLAVVNIIGGCGICRV
jgi:amino acid permease